MTQSQRWHQRVPRNVHRHVSRTLRFNQSDVTLWHSFTFLFNIGVPVLVGLWVGQLGAGVAGAVAGLLFTLSDSDGSLGQRFALLARASAVVVGLGYLGFCFGGFTFWFWLTFGLLTFATAWLSLVGNAASSALRYGALALITTASLPEGNNATLGMVLVAVAANLVTRIVGIIFFPQVPVISLRVSLEDTPRGWAGYRYCLVYALMVAVGLIVGQLEGVARPMWIAVTVLLVMQPDARASYERIAQRIFGTFLGVLAASIVVSLLHATWLLTLAIMIIAFYVPHGAARNYWAYAALIALLVLVLYDFAAPHHGFNLELLRERLVDALWGGALGTIGTLVAFPPPKRRMKAEG